MVSLTIQADVYKGKINMKLEKRDPKSLLWSSVVWYLESFVVLFYAIWDGEECENSGSSKWFQLVLFTAVVWWKKVSTRPFHRRELTWIASLLLFTRRRLRIIAFTTRIQRRNQLEGMIKMTLITNGYNLFSEYYVQYSKKGEIS